MQNEFVVPIVGEMLAEQFERDGLVKSLGCSAARARELVELRRARQAANIKATFEVLRDIRVDMQRGRTKGVKQP